MKNILLNRKKCKFTQSFSIYFYAIYNLKKAICSYSLYSVIIDNAWWKILQYIKQKTEYSLNSWLSDCKSYLPPGGGQILILENI